MTTPCRMHSGMARRARSGRSPASHEAIWAHPSADTTFTGQPRHPPRKTNSRAPSSSHQHPTYPGFDQDGVAQRAARVQRRHQRRHVGLLTVRGDKRDHVEGWRIRPRRNRRRSDSHRRRRRAMDAAAGIRGGHPGQRHALRRRRGYARRIGREGLAHLRDGFDAPRLDQAEIRAGRGDARAVQRAVRGALGVPARRLHGEPLPRRRP